MKEKDPNVCPKKKSCMFGGRMGGIDICNFMEIKGYSRPCPVKNCTEYKKGRQIKKARTVLYDL